MSHTFYPAKHFDGETAEARLIDLHIDGERRALIADGVEWPLDDIRMLKDENHDHFVTLRRAGTSLERLVLADRSVLDHLPNADLREPVTNIGSLMKCGAAAIASVALIVFVLVPIMANQLAGFIPPKGEQALGEVTLNQIRTAMSENELAPIGLCENPEGLAALEKMQQRLSGFADLEYDLSVHVLDHDMVNAFALPGGFIVFFRGLIEEAGAPEEVAAVFAHEIGHVASRDPTRNALRSAGSIGVLGLLFGDFAGGAVVLFLTNRLIDAQYSQAAEAQADVFAHGMMRGADLAPSALADMFERFQALGGEPEGITAHFLSHPALGNRIEAAREATPKGMNTRPILSDEEWNALQNICN